jgi:hypothetical protein
MNAILIISTFFALLMTILVETSEAKITFADTYYSDDRIKFCNQQFYYPQWESPPHPYDPNELGQALYDNCGERGSQCEGKWAKIPRSGSYDDFVQVRHANYLGWDSRNNLIETMKWAWRKDYYEPQHGDCYDNTNSWTALSYFRNLKVALYDCDGNNGGSAYGCNFASSLEVELKTRDPKGYWLCKHPDVINLAGTAPIPLASQTAAVFSMLCSGWLGDRVDCGIYNNFVGRLDEIHKDCVEQVKNATIIYSSE